MKNDSTELHFFAEVMSLYQRQRSLILLLMRISAINLILLFLVSAAGMAHSITARGQSIEDTYVELEFDDASIRDVLTAIEEQTEFSFSILSHTIDDKHKVSLDAGTYSVKDALDLILEGTGLGYEQTGNYIILSPKNEREETQANDKHLKNEADQPEAETPLALVTGTVKDAATQEPLAGVNIIVKGTTKGTTTDIFGKFSIEAEDDDLLVFSFIGFKPYEIQVSGRTEIDVPMERDITALQEVVVNAGYWQVKDKEQTGNIVRVTADDISKQPVSNALASLEGRLAGVSIQQNTGVPGGAFNLEIRGRNSLRGGVLNNGNLPLYVIDGVPVTSSPLTSSSFVGSPLMGGDPLSAINPSDIENIEILKDADATAIYGSRGANGVVLITTKKGQVGKTKVDVNIYMGGGKVSNQLDLLNTQQYLEMRKEALKNDGLLPMDPSSYFFVPDAFLWDTTRYTDWQKKIIGGTAQITNVQTSLTAGDENIQFLIGGGYFLEGSVFPGDSRYKKGSIHFNLNHISENEKFHTGISVSYVGEDNHVSATDLTNYAVTLPPNAPLPYKDDGTLNSENFTWANNPFAELEKKYKSNTKNLIANSILRYQITNGLELKTSLGYTTMQFKEVSTVPISSYPYTNPNNTAYASYGDGSLRTWIIEPQLAYIKSIGNSKLNVLIGTTFQENVSERQSLTATGFRNDALIDNIKAASGITLNDYNYRQYKYNAVFGRINYDFNSRYIINLTGRRDGSSRFGPGKQFANFGAIGIAWIFSNESFITENASFLSFGKLRGSYGTTGNDQIPDYAYLNSYSATTYRYNNTNGLVPSRISNPDYSWETNKKIEAALEVGFLDDRIQFTASWYRNRSANQLVGYALAPTTGFSSVQFNLPAIVENTGWEFEFSSTNIHSTKLKWVTGLNITVPRNKLVSYPNIEGSSYATTYVVGQSLYIQKFYHFTGVDPQTGLYTIEDVDKDGSFNDEDKKPVNFGQKFYGGLLNSLIYKGFQFDFLFQFVKQKGISPLGYFNKPGVGVNQPTDVLTRWQVEGNVTDVQKYSFISADESYSWAQSSDKIVSDASFIRLKNVSISYQLPLQWAKRIKMQSARIYLQGQNLLTITNYLGIDPETQNPQVLPPLRVLTAGIQLTL